MKLRQKNEKCIATTLKLAIEFFIAKSYNEDEKILATSHDM